MINESNSIDRIEIVYYTDPLCCWSWAFEPHWRKLLSVLRGHVSYRYCMGGLIEDWNSYHDEVNSVSRPAQMGPVWMQAGHIANVPVYDSIWVKDPPASSYLSCIAMKAATLQSPEFGEQCLDALRVAVMTKGINIAKQSAIHDVVNSIPGIDMERFKADLVNGKGYELFAKDLQETRYRNITRFPTLVINDANGKGLVVTGYQPYDILVNKLSKELNVSKEMVQPEVLAEKE